MYDNYLLIYMSSEWIVFHNIKGSKVKQASEEYILYDLYFTEKMMKMRIIDENNNMKN